MKSLLTTLAMCLSICVLTLVGTCYSQDAGAAPPKGGVELPLNQQQISISQRYSRFEQTLLKIIEITKENDPARADLLLRAIGKSREQRISPQLETIVKLLGEERLGEASNRQEDLIGSLVVVLEILQSEDERDRLKNEIDRLQDLIKDFDRLIGKEKDVRADTERGGDFDEMKKKQEEVRKLAEGLKQKMEQQDQEAESKDQSGDPANSEAGNNSETESMPGDQQKQDSEQQEENNTPEDTQDKKPTDPEKSEKQDQTNKDSEKESQKKPADSSQSPSKSQESPQQDSQPQDSQQSESQQNQSQEQNQQQQQDEQQKSEEKKKSDPPQSPRADAQQQQKTPGRQELEDAREKMEEAIKELEKKQREGASDKQDEALLELQKAKAKLEELLRQLREEEMELFLMALEARFRKMLEQEYLIKDGTVKLAAINEQERLARHSQRAVQLARDQAEVMLEADQALTLLREEGTSVAFPEAVLQLREDMQLVSGRLEKIDVGEITVAIEDDLIEGLKELIESLQKELEKLQNKDDNQQQQQQEQEPQDPALVDQLAEMKILRSLQNRINRRTRQYGLEVDGEQASNPEMIRLLRQLSARQTRVFRATYDLSSGKNK